MNLNGVDIKQVGQIIRSVSEAQSKRLFKLENNSHERGAIAYTVISAEIFMALFDAGLPISTIIEEIDPTEIILSAMHEVGFIVSDNISLEVTIDEVDETEGVDQEEDLPYLPLHAPDDCDSLTEEDIERLTVERSFNDPPDNPLYDCLPRD